jgi:hypothetical protein
MELQGKNGLVLYRFDGIMRQVGWVDDNGRLWTNNYKGPKDNMEPVWAKVVSNVE